MKNKKHTKILKNGAPEILCLQFKSPAPGRKNIKKAFLMFSNNVSIAEPLFKSGLKIETCPVLSKSHSGYFAK